MKLLRPLIWILAALLATIGHAMNAPETGVDWRPIAFQRSGTIIESDTMGPGLSIDIMMIFQSGGLGEKNGLIKAFAIQYSTEHVWAQFLDEKGDVLGYSKTFRRAVTDDGAADELVWTTESQGLGESGYVEAQSTVKCKMNADGSVEFLSDTTYVAHWFLGLVRHKGRVHGVNLFEKAYDLPKGSP